jgi:hypothetical protein
MANNVGNISVKLGMDSTAFRDAINAVGADASKFTAKMESIGGDAVGALGKGAKKVSYKVGNTLNQLAFGAEDFMSQLENSGVGAGIRAATNNASALAAAFGPIPLLVTVIGTSIASVVVPRMIEWIYQTDALRERWANLGTQTLTTIDEMETRLRAMQQFRGGMSGDQFADTEKKLKEEVGLRDDQEKTLRKKIMSLNEMLVEVIKEQDTFFGRIGEATGLYGNDLAIKAEQITKTMEELQQKLDDVRKKGADARTNLNVFKDVAFVKEDAKAAGKSSQGGGGGMRQISSDVIDSTQAFSSINRAIIDTNQKTDEKIEANTRMAAAHLSDISKVTRDEQKDRVAQGNQLTTVTIGL